MSSNRYPLTLLPGSFAVARLDPGVEVPPWVDGAVAAGGDLVSLTRTRDELSIVCPGSLVPPDVKAELGWRAFKLEGPVPFSTVGVISSLTTPLAALGISCFVLSTFDTDYLLLKEAVRGRAEEALAKAGYPVTPG